VNEKNEKKKNDEQDADERKVTPQATTQAQAQATAVGQAQATTQAQVVASAEAETSEEVARMEAGKLLAQIRYLVANGQGDVLRKDVYNQARLVSLTRADIQLLKVVRDEEDKLQR